VEVVVDGAAEVEIRGDSGTVRNLSGQPAQLRRFQCTGVLPANPADFRFIGVNGRGRQELVRDPRNGGAAVVRIEDPEGGAQAYTFELTWAGAGTPGGPNHGGQWDQRENRPDPSQWDQRDRTWDRNRPVNRRYTADQAIRICQDAVRQQANSRFRTSYVTFQRTTIDDNPGRNDWVIGTFSLRRGYRGQETHRFACSVDFDNGQVRSAQIDPLDRGRNVPGYQGGGSQAIQSCQRAVEQRLRRDGYDRVDFASINADDRPGRNDWIVGNARADGRYGVDAFNFSCSVDLNDGSIRSVDVTRR
jgi:hypothetical protein